MHCVSSVLLLVAASAGADYVRVRGVAPSQDGLYIGPRKFTCLDHSKTMDISRLNDDFCDCEDGSDEPGTNACPNGRFYCINKGFRGTYLHSLAVNDGVCDCCSGEDEFSRKTPCPNTCEADGATWRAARAAAIQKAEEGSRQRLEYEQFAKTAAADRASRMAASRASLKPAKAAVESAQTVASIAEEAERKVNEQRQKESSVSDEHIVRSLKLESATREDLLSLLIAFAKKTSTGSQLADLIRERQPAPEPTPDAMLGVEAEAAAPADAPLWPENAGVAVEEFRSPEGDAARTALTSAKDRVSTLERELTAIEEEAAADYGPGGVFFKLKGQCYSLKVNQYTYEACPFASAKQDHTSLGSFSSWGNKTVNGESEVDYTIMNFVGGSTCWNGPARSLALLFECGSSDAMLSVDEPEKCTYTARFTSPAACDAKAARQLYMELEVDVGGAQREEL